MKRLAVFGNLHNHQPQVPEIMPDTTPEAPKTPEQIKDELMTVRPGSPEEMKLLGEHRAYTAMNRSNPQTQAEANAQAMIETAQHDIIAGHAAHTAVHATVHAAAEQPQQIEVRHA